MIKQLNNPTSIRYQELKDKLLSNKVPFYYENYSTKSVPLSDCPEGHSDIGFYAHTLLTRPEITRYSQQLSPVLDEFLGVFDEIIQFNNLSNNYYLLRACVNIVHPEVPRKITVPHVDHDFDHKNMLIYLTNSGGETYVEGESFDPKEDDIIVFDGEHYMRTPKTDRRVIIVATFCDW